MVRRALVPLISAAALLLPASPLGAARAVPVHPIALEHPERGIRDGTGVADDAVVLVEWVIGADELMACRTATPELRRTQHEYRGRIRMTAYVVDTDTALVRSFLRRERLPSIELHRITDRQFQRDFARRLGPDGRTPTLLVTANGANIGSFDAGVRTAAGRRGVTEFGVQIDALLNPASARGE